MLVPEFENLQDFDQKVDIFFEEQKEQKFSTFLENENLVIVFQDGNSINIHNQERVY